MQHTTIKVEKGLAYLANPYKELLPNLMSLPSKLYLDFERGATTNQFHTNAPDGVYGIEQFGGEIWEIETTKGWSRITAAEYETYKGTNVSLRPFRKFLGQEVNAETTPDRMHGGEKFEPRVYFTFKHPKTKEVKQSGLYTALELLDTDLLTIQEKACYCNCQSCGETYVVECNCQIYADEFEHTETNWEHPQPAQPSQQEGETKSYSGVGRNTAEIAKIDKERDDLAEKRYQLRELSIKNIIPGYAKQRYSSTNIRDAFDIGWMQAEQHFEDQSQHTATARAEKDAEIEMVNTVGLRLIAEKDKALAESQSRVKELEEEIRKRDSFLDFHNILSGFKMFKDKF